MTKEGSFNEIVPEEIGIRQEGSKLEGPEVEAEEMSLEGIRAFAEDFQRRLREAEEQKEKDIKAKMSEREALIAEGASTIELLNKGKEILEYFEPQKLSGADQKKLEEFKQRVKSVEEKLEGIEARIKEVSDQPEIGGRLYEDAKKENAERKAEKIYEEGLRDLGQRIDDLAKRIKESAEKRVRAYENRDEIEKAYWKAKRELETALEDAIKTKGLLKTDKGAKYASHLREIFREADVADIQLKFQTEREQLGFLQGKGKKAIDRFLASGREFKEVTEAEEKLVVSQKEREDCDKDRDNLAEQYKEIILEAWSVQDKLDELRSEHGRAYNLPENLRYGRYGLEKEIERLAGMGAWEDGRKVEGKYKSRSEARSRDPKSGGLLDIWEYIDHKSGEFVYFDPRKKEKKEE